MGIREKWLQAHSTDDLMATGADTALQDFEVREYMLGEHVYQAGDPSHELYLILSGKVMEYVEHAEGTRTIAEMEVADFLGEMDCLRGAPRTVYALATESCRVLVIPEQAVDQLIGGLPRWFVSLIEALVTRVQQADKRLADDCQGG